MNFTTHTVSVYLNDSRDRGFGFDNEFSPAQIRLAGQFDLRTWDRDGATAVLGSIYYQLNDVDPASDNAYPWTGTWRAARNRSLSVGDVVILDEQAYAVERVGFTEISRDQVRAAINAHTIANEPGFTRPAR